ncbi:deoxyadenosine/deoxycytidine kinase [Methylohalomonas lacus]|uniref:Deoxyadenosine/deoxycytidine kinase n=1 Tax=Methylohalomonas lacus TaxID=398773 RepID=A0AAE3HKP1_9GAMM|nr:deoxynucleoside kinase [Methylohalomonas lacus]MCS3902177.1 deoxyadenosine/deoxycytidine kinase [Methylohalomonas lacus]
MPSNNRSGYIVVEGPIGVGKTTLAKRLAQAYQTDLLLERAEDNPFLPRFYQDPENAALPTQLFFLFQRAQQIQSLRQGDLFQPARVVDFMIEKDRLFAALTLNRDELALYQQVYDRMTLAAPQPDLVIYLQAPIEVLLKRIETRAIDYEQLIDESYLRRVAEAYVEFFHHYERSPLLIVNTADFNLAAGHDDFNLLLERIRDLPPGRHYFNPGAI